MTREASASRLPHPRRLRRRGGRMVGRTRLFFFNTCGTNVGATRSHMTCFPAILQVFFTSPSLTTT